MKGFALIVLFMLLAMICWGVYGPLLQAAQTAMGSSLRPFVCVGIAYFAVAVVLPIVLLQMLGEHGHWTAKGMLWSGIAGAAGAIGALGVILALKNGGSPIYVMPLVFGGAPVVNSVLTIFFAGTYKQIKAIFLAGLIIVLVGSMTVLIFRPATPHPPAPKETAATTPSATADAKAAPAHSGQPWGQLLVIAFTALTALCWGSYGPTLHLGQMAMAGSRLRPFLCVGVMYFLIAVCVPSIMLFSGADQAGNWNVGGVWWGIIGGATGALGAMGIIMAFNMGAKPVYIMPLVFGGAPVVNTLVSLSQAGTVNQIGPIFIAGLILVVAGAVTVLVFAPRGHAHPPAGKSAEPIPPRPTPPALR